MEKFHFVLKTPKSISLSHGDEDERYKIRCHAQTQRRAVSRSPAPKAAPKSRKLPHQTSINGTLALRSESASSLIDSDRGASQANPGTAITTSVWHHGFKHVADVEKIWSPLSFIPQNSFDPFNSTPLAQDPTTIQIFQFASSDFSNVNFRAEALDFSDVSTKAFRHTKALSQRTRLSLRNEMVMFATLAYASAAMGWRFGMRYQQRPPEYFIQQAYATIRHRLCQSTHVDNVLILSIYSLAASEMWVKNYGAAKTHLTILRQMIEQMGGIAKLETYVMDSVILGTKFLALFTNSAPILSLDWEPDIWQPRGIQQLPSYLDPEASDFGKQFFSTGNAAIIGIPLQTIIGDMKALWQTSHWIWAQTTPSPSDERYLYLKNQAISHRLLFMQGNQGLRESLRLALLLWLLSVTEYMGAKVAAVEILHYLKSAQKNLSPATETTGVNFHGIQLWINSVGAMISLPASTARCGRPQGCHCDSHEQAKFFTEEVQRGARTLGLMIDRDAMRSFLVGYFYAENRQGPALSQLVEAVDRAKKLINRFKLIEAEPAKGTVRALVVANIRKR